MGQLRPRCGFDGDALRSEPSDRNHAPRAWYCACSLIRPMDGIKRFLIALSIAGCGGGGGGGGMPIDGGDGPGTGHDADIDGMPAPANDRCVNAPTISIASTHSEISTTAAGANADLAAPCGTAGTPDVFFKFTLTRRELVYADTFGATGNTALYFASSCVAARTASTTP